VRDRFPPPTSLKLLEDTLQEELYKILLETVQNLYVSGPRRIAAVLRVKVIQRHIDKEMYTVSVVFPLFCSTPVQFTFYMLLNVCMYNIYKASVSPSSVQQSCWPLPAQTFSGPSSLALATRFYCLRFETSLFVAIDDSQCHGGGIRPHLHTGN
jgi:hypothetical protein